MRRDDNAQVARCFSQDTHERISARREVPARHEAAAARLHELFDELRVNQESVKPGRQGTQAITRSKA